MERRSTKSPDAAGVPVFALYGEAAGPGDAEFLHLERLSARSERYGWEIGRHIHRGLFQAVFLFDRSVRAILDNGGVEATAPCVVLVPPGAVHAFAFEPETQGFVLTLAAAWTGPQGVARAAGAFEGVMSAPAVVDLGEDAGPCRGLLEHLHHELRERRPGYALMSEWLAAGILLTLSRRVRPGAPVSSAEDRRAAVFARFRLLVEDHYAEHWPVARYARALAISESRLDRICRALAGRSAFEMAQDRVLLEARRRLVHVAAPVSALAYELGYEDPAYFCRFFKRHVGRTPTQWRREQRERLAAPG